MAKYGWKESGGRMFRWWVRAALLAAAVPALFAQSDGVIRVDVNLVRVVATVKNRASARFFLARSQTESRGNRRDPYGKR